MSSLENKKIKDSYKDLLQISNNNIGVDNTLRSISDGEGTISALKISSSEVSIDGNLEASSITINNKSVATQDWVTSNTSTGALINWTETNGHIIPNSNASFDLGNAEYKVRHLFLSDNSMWLGDEIKLESYAKKKRNRSKLPKWFEVNTPSVTTEEIFNWHNTEFDLENKISSFDEISLFALTEFAKIKIGNFELTSSDIYPSQYNEDGSINDIYDPLDYEYIIDDDQSFKVNSFLSNLNSFNTEERKQKILQIDETGDGIQFVDQELLRGEKGTQGIAGPQGDSGPQGIPGLQGDIGLKGEQGDAFVYSDFTTEQLESLVGEKGEQGIPGLQGDIGLKGEQGDAFVYSDFTTSQLESLVGEKGNKGETAPRGIDGSDGEKGEKGIQGNPGSQGITGPQGDIGLKGEQGDAFVFSDFTTEQLESLAGEKGDKGEQGISGPQGDIGLKGEQGIQGNAGDVGEKGEQGIPGLQGDIGLKGEQGIQGDKGDAGDKGEQGIQGVGEKGDKGSNGQDGVGFLNGTTTGQIHYSGGNVGIGTDNPAEKLDVSGNVQLLNRINTKGDTIITADVNNINAGSSIRFNVDGAGSEKEMMRIKHDGTVGIGTDAPIQSLHTTGDIQMENNTAIWTTHSNGTRYKMLQNYSNNATYLDNVEGGIIFRTGLSNTPERMRIDAETGNVGIGTNSPTQELHISGLGRVKATSEDGSAWSYYSTENASNNKSWQFGQLIGNRADYNDQFFILPQYHDVDGNAVANSDYGLYITNDSETPANSGRVGIGTNSPAEKLTVIGDILIDNNMNSTLYLGKGAEGVDGVTKIKCTQTGTDTDELGLSFFVHGSSSGTTLPYEAMSITHTGNVGIGTTNPQFKFEIHDESDITMRIHRPNSGLTANDTCGIGFSQRNDDAEPTGDTRAGIFSAYNGDLFLSARAGGNINSNPMDYSRLFIEASTGAVGIGTNSPDAKLEISGGGTGVWLKTNNITNRSSNTMAGQNYINLTNQLPTDENSFEIGPGYINLNRDDNVPINQLSFGMNGMLSAAFEVGGTTNSDHSLRFKVGQNDSNKAGIERMRIDSTGAVTINSGVILSGAFGTISTGGTLATVVPSVDDTRVFSLIGASNRSRGGAVGVVDIRTPQASDFPKGAISCGFTSWNLNSTSPYADFINFNTYTDSSGGNSTMMLVSKSSNGIKFSRLGFSVDTNYSLGSIYTVNVTSGSDISVKENVNEITDGLQKISALRPVTFHWTNEYIENGFSKNESENVYDENGERILPNQKITNVGLIAQEVEEVIPTIVHNDRISLSGTDDTIKSIDYDKIVPYLIASIKELSEKVNDLQDQIDILKQN